MTPRRIVSLVPSLTELVCWLGHSEQLVGRTTFCTEPAGMIDAVPHFGGTKNPKVAEIIAAAPDLVLANKEENRREDVEALQAAGLQVHVTDPNTVAEAIAMVTGLGQVLGAHEKAQALAEETRQALAEGDGSRAMRTFVAVWKAPLLGLGGQTYGSDLLECAGGYNVLRDRARYPEVTPVEVATLAPELVLLPDEPYPFKPSDGAAFEGVAPARVVDGKLLWWYGPRMPGAIRTLRAMLRAR